jgi:hypothetical protein
MTNSLAAALRSYTGRGTSPFPRRDPRAVAGPVLAEIERLMNEMNELEPDWTSHSLASATAWAEAEMRARHPKLDDDALASLAWCWSYDRK